MYTREIKGRKAESGSEQRDEIKRKRERERVKRTYTGAHVCVLYGRPLRKLGLMRTARGGARWQELRESARNPEGDERRGRGKSEREREREGERIKRREDGTRARAEKSERARAPACDAAV